MRELTAIDLCCGAGGWQVAARGLPIRFVAAVDWAEDCCLTVKYNHPDVPVACADVTTLDLSGLAGKVDLVLGAIPCEEVSKARDNRAAAPEVIARWRELIDWMLASVSAIAPRWWAIENVAGMGKHLPLFTPNVVLDSSLWSAQKRKRLFAGRFPMPVSHPHGAGALSSALRRGPYRIGVHTLRQASGAGHKWYGSSRTGASSIAVKRIVPASRPSPTILTFSGRHERGFVIRMADGRERVLQFTEAASLQGFPGDFVFVANEGRAWKMLAQAVQIDTARAILDGIVAEAEREAAA